jgi:hypothetical protein
MTVEVAPLRPGERFRVIFADAEVEVKGTAFDVASRRGKLLSVRVHHGRVEVRPVDGGSVILEAGDAWPTARDFPTSEPAVRPKPTPREPARRRPRKDDGPPAPPPSVVAPGPAPLERAAPPPPRPSPTATELAFRRGWDALRAGHAAAAASEFARARVAGERDPLTEDAWFWEGVALSRARRPAAAARALRSFLAQFPASPRRAEVTALLGWQLLALGDLDGAEARFRVLADDHPEELRAEVQRGLAEIHRRRTKGSTPDPGR